MIYTPEIIAYIRQHYNVDMRGEDIASAIGVSYTSLKKKVAKLKRTGYPIKYKQYNAPAEIGEVRQRTDGTGVKLMEKTAGGWKYVKSTNREYTRTIQQPKPQPMPTRKQRKVAAKPQPIKRTGMTDEEKLAAGYQRVKLDNRTWVLRSPDKIKTA